MHSRRFAAAALLFCLAVAPGCRQAAIALGPTPSLARANTDDLLGSLASRFGPVQLDPGFLARRAKLVRASLVPSQAFDDASIWTETNGNERGVGYVGARAGSGYRIGASAEARAPALPAEYRGSLKLRRLGDGEFEWTMRDELAVGRISAAALARALGQALLALEGLDEAEARTRWREALPRTGAALGRLFSLDVLQLQHDAQGGTLATLTATLHPTGIAPAFPRYAHYLATYGPVMRLRATASDATGAAWWDLDFADGRFALRLRLHGGELAPLQGIPRPIPGSLRVRTGFSTKMGMLRVGFRALDAEVLLVRDSHEKGFAARFRTSPDWQLPFLAEQLVGSSLRRPFQDEGALLAYSLRDAEGRETLLVRDYRIAVKESWVVRWLGGLTGTVEEFRQNAEAEADRFTAEVLQALREDVLELARQEQKPASGAGRAPHAPPSTERQRYQLATVR